MEKEYFSTALALMCLLGDAAPAQASTSGEMAAFVCANMGGDVSGPSMGVAKTEGQLALLVEAVWQVEHRAAALAALAPKAVAQLSLLAAAVLKGATSLSRKASQEQNQGKNNKNKNKNNKDNAILESLLKVTSITLKKCSQHYRDSRSSLDVQAATGGEGNKALSQSPLSVMTDCLLALLSIGFKPEPLLLQCMADLYSCIGYLSADTAVRKRFDLFVSRLLAPTMTILEIAGPCDDSLAIIKVISDALFADDDDRALVELTSLSLSDMGELLGAQRNKNKIPLSFYSTFYFVVSDTYGELIKGADEHSNDFGFVASALYSNFAMASLALSTRPAPQGQEADSWLLRASHKHCSRLLHSCFLLSQCLDSAAQAAINSSKKRKITPSCTQQLLRKRMFEALSRALSSSVSSIPHHDSMAVYVSALKRQAADSLAGVLEAECEETAVAHLDTMGVLGAIDHRALTEMDGGGVLAALIAARPLAGSHSALLLDSCRGFLLTALGLYRQLRRLDDFVSCFSSTTAAAPGEGGAMVYLLEEASVFEEVVSALRTIPVGQVEAVWLTLDEGKSSRAQQLLTLAFCSSRQGVSDSLAFAPLSVMQSVLQKASADVESALPGSGLGPRVVEAVLGLACSMLNRSYAAKDRAGWSALLPPLEGLVLGTRDIPLTITALKLATTYDVYFGSSDDGDASSLLPMLEQQLLVCVQRAAADSEASTQATLFSLISRSCLVFDHLLDGELLPAFRALLESTITSGCGCGGSAEVNKEIFLESSAAAAALADTLLSAVSAAAALLSTSKQTKGRKSGSKAQPLALQRLCHLLGAFGDSLHHTDDATLTASLSLMADIATSLTLGGGAVDTDTANAWRHCLCLLAAHVARVRSASFGGRHEIWLQMAMAQTPKSAYSALLAAVCDASCPFPLRAADTSCALLAHLAALTDMALVASLRSGDMTVGVDYIDAVLCATRGVCSSKNPSASNSVAVFTMFRAVVSCLCSLDARLLAEERVAAMFIWLKGGFVDALIKQATEEGGGQSRRSLALLIAAECLRLTVKLAPTDSAPAVALLLQAENMLLSPTASSAFEPEAWLYVTGVCLLSSKALRRPLTPQGLSALCRRLTTQVLTQGFTEGGLLHGGEVWYEESSQVFFRALVECSPVAGSECLHRLLRELADSHEQRSLRHAMMGALALLECHRARQEAVAAACRCLEMCSVRVGAVSLRYLCTALKRGLSALSHKHSVKGTAHSTQGGGGNSTDQTDTLSAGGLSALVGSTIHILAGLCHRLDGLRGDELAALQLLDLLGQLFSLQAQLPLLNNSIGALSLSLRQCVEFALSDPLALSSPHTATTYGSSISHCLKMLASSNNMSKHLYLFAAIAVDTLSLSAAPPQQMRDGLVSGIFALFERSHPQDRQRINKLLTDIGRSAFADINIVYMQEWKFVGKA